MIIQILQANSHALEALVKLSKKALDIYAEMIIMYM